LWSEGVTGTEILQRWSTQYGDSVLLQQTRCEWNEMFQNGQTSIWCRAVIASFLNNKSVWQFSTEGRKLLIFLTMIKCWKR